MAELSMQTGVARTQAGVLDDSAQKIKKAKGEIDGLIGELKGSWWGEDQKKFDTKWNGQYSGDLTKAIGGLTTAADQIRTEAKQQDKASH